MATLDEARKSIIEERNRWNRWAKIWAAIHGLTGIGLIVLAAWSAFMTARDWNDNGPQLVIAGVIGGLGAVNMFWNAAAKKRANRGARVAAQNLLTKLDLKDADPDAALEKLAIVRSAQSNGIDASDSGGAEVFAQLAGNTDARAVP